MIDPSGRPSDSTDESATIALAGLALTDTASQPDDDDLAEDAACVDGSVLEGGGQILRNALALSALQRQRRPLRVHSIRLGRRKPGLASQHAAGVRLCAGMVDAAIEGVEVGSTEIRFEPRSSAARALAGSHFVGDAVTAGACTLLLQAALPIAVFAAAAADGPAPARPITLELRGGTNAEMAPPIDYVTDVLLPFLRRHFGISASVELLKRGYYPRGGGHVRVSVTPLEPGRPLPAPTLLDRGDIVRVTGRAYVAGKVAATAAHELRDAALAVLRPALAASVDIEIAVVVEPPELVGVRPPGSGSGILLYAHTSTGCVLAGDALGSPQAQSADVGARAATFLLEQIAHGGCVDEYLQDQIVIFLALAGGTSRVRTGPISLHTRTAIHIAELLTAARFELVEEEKGPAGGTMLISCRGIGLC